MEKWSGRSPERNRRQLNRGPAEPAACHAAPGHKQPALDRGFCPPSPPKGMPKRTKRAISPPDPTTAAITAVNDGNQQREQQRKRKRSEGEKEADPQAETVTANADTTSSSAGKVAYQDGADTALTSSAANMIVIKACLRLMRIVFGAG